MIVAWIVFRRVKEFPAQHPRISAEELQVIHNGIQSSETEAIAVAGSQEKIDKVSLVFMFLGRMAFAMVFFGLVTWGPSYLVHERGLSLQYSGLATFCIFLAGTLGEISGGFISDKFRGRQIFPKVLRLLLLVSGVVSLASLASISYIHSATLAIAVICLGFYFEMFGGLYWLIPGMITPHKNLGFVGGVLNFAGQIGGATVGIASGIIVQHFGYQAMLVYYACCAAVYLVCSQFIRFRQ